MMIQMGFILIGCWGINMTNEELKKAANDLENSLKAEEIARLRGIQSKLRQDNLGYAAASREESGRRQGKEAEKEWESLLKLTAHAKEPQQGYDNWLASVSSILAMCQQLQKALSLDNPINTVLNTVYNKAAPYAGAIGNMIADGLTPDPKVTLPGLQHFVEFTADGKLKLDSLTDNLRRTDGKPFTQEQAYILENSFPAGIRLWLDQNDYEVDPTRPNAADPSKPNAYRHKDSLAPLTKAKFDEIRNDPQLGLNKFLSGTFEMKVDQASQAPRP